VIYFAAIITTGLAAEKKNGRFSVAPPGLLGFISAPNNRDSAQTTEIQRDSATFAGTHLHQML